MEQKRQKVMEQLRRMLDGAQQAKDAGCQLYFMHANCAIEFAQNVQALLEAAEMGEKEERALPIQEMTAEEKAEIEAAHKRFFEKLMTSQEQANEDFDSGIYNPIAIGYAKIALEDLGLTSSVLRKFESAMEKALDLYDAAQARKIYRRIEG